MNLIFPVPSPASPNDRIQGRLLRWAALFLLFTSIALTLAPAARAHTWAVPLRWMHWIGLAVWFGGYSLVHALTVRQLPERDPYLLSVAGLLSGWGLLTVWRLSNGFGLRQTLWLALCLALFALALRFQNIPQILRRYKYIWLITGLLLLGLTFFFGTYPDGSLDGPRLWLGCCGVFVQPSEFLKLLLIVYLAAYLADSYGSGFTGFRTLAPAFIIMAAAVTLLLAQRDLGTASLFVVLFTVMLFMATEKRRYVALILVGMVLALVVGYRYFDVVRLRIDAWVNPWQDADGRAYQIVQSLIAIASGEFLGRGPGMGSPALVPVTHSDFIFAAISEEFGMVGIVAIVALLALFTFRGLRTALRAADPYQRYLAAGLTSYLIAQSVLIIGGNLRLLPLTGITLPFVSYGGSSLLTSFIALLLLEQISGHTADNAVAVTNPRPVLYLGAGFLAALAGIALLGGWWAIVRSADLTARKDNLRPAISEFYTPRGDILDRHDAKIATTIGNPGDYSRTILYPALSPIIGYANLDYGQTGLELDMNPVLRGLQGNSALTVWWTDLLYGQLPRGLDVRLTLDLNIQQIADQQLEGHSGAAVLLNASSGEILAIASHPGFDANQLAETWDSLIDDPASPLLNRASAGQYPLGTALGPFALASANLPGALPSVPQPLDVTLNGHTIGCTQTIANDVNWGSAVAAGCPTPLIDLSGRIGAGGLKDKLTALGFYTQPEIPLLTPDPKNTVTSVDDVQLRLGLNDLHVSPLQVALAASAISASGQVPAAQIVNAMRAPDGSWDAAQDGLSTTQALPSGNARKTAEMLANADRRTWDSLGSAVNVDDQPVTWYIAGTLPDLGGEPLALAVVLEEDNPDLAKQIGDSLLAAANR